MFSAFQPLRDQKPNSHIRDRLPERPASDSSDETVETAIAGDAEYPGDVIPNRNGKLGWLLLGWSLFSPMNRRRALYIFLSVLALFLVGTVVVLSSITYYLAIDPNAYLSDLEVPIYDNETSWDPVEHGAVQHVPKIIHQTWKTETLPVRWQNLSQGCRDMMPD